MKSYLRFPASLVSSFLLAAGFSRAAEVLDPLSRDASRPLDTGDVPAAACSGVPCSFIRQLA
jgi:hypothetical protein